MEKRMRLKLPKLLCSSLTACRPRPEDLYNVVETNSSHSLVLTDSKTECQQRQSQRPKAHYALSSSHPLTSIFPANPFYDDNRSFRVLRKTRNRKRSQFGSDSLFISGFKSAGSWCWSSSEEEEEEDEGDTLFSSRSFSSESSTAESFAVVKKSEDPFEDFRNSMVEMIVERQIFAAAELQKLLQCFLSLNSRQHHSVIVQVFFDIYVTFFSP